MRNENCDPTSLDQVAEFLRTAPLACVRDAQAVIQERVLREARKMKAPDLNPASDAEMRGSLGKGFLVAAFVVSIAAGAFYFTGGQGSSNVQKSDERRGRSTSTELEARLEAATVEDLTGPQQTGISLATLSSYLDRIGLAPMRFRLSESERGLIVVPVSLGVEQERWPRERQCELIVERHEGRDGEQIRISLSNILSTECPQDWFGLLRMNLHLLSGTFSIDGKGSVQLTHVVPVDDGAPSFAEFRTVTLRLLCAARDIRNDISTMVEDWHQEPDSRGSTSDKKTKIFRHVEARSDSLLWRPKGLLD